MSRETTLMIIILTGLALSFYLFMKKTEIRQTLFAFITAQLFSWPFSIALVYIHALENPVRLFPKATDTSFVLAYLLFPSIFALYYIRYPWSVPSGRQMLYTLLICGASAFLHALIEQYSDLVTYIHFSWYWNFIAYLLFFYLSRQYIDWFFTQLTALAPGPRQ